MGFQHKYVQLSPKNQLKTIEAFYFLKQKKATYLLNDKRSAGGEGDSRGGNKEAIKYDGKDKD